VGSDERTRTMILRRLAMMEAETPPEPKRYGPWCDAGVGCPLSPPYAETQQSVERRPQAQRMSSH
jgi:hypothetical protein